MSFDTCSYDTCVPLFLSLLGVPQVHSTYYYNIMIVRKKVPSYTYANSDTEVVQS